jgi:hypothetical protein
MLVYIWGSRGRERNELVRLPVTAICRDRDFGVIVGLTDMIQTVHER